MLQINNEIVQVSADCSACPCTIARAKGGTSQANAAAGARAVLVRRVNGNSLTGPITFTVSNILGLGTGDSTVSLTAGTDFAVTLLVANDVLIVGEEFLQISSPCYALNEAYVCPVLCAQLYGGYGAAAAVLQFRVQR